MGGAMASGRISWLRSIDPSSGTIGVSVGPPGTTTLTVMPVPSIPGQAGAPGFQAGLGRAVGREAGIEHRESWVVTLMIRPEFLARITGTAEGHVERA